MANILDEALTGKYKTMPLVYKNPVPKPVNTELPTQTKLTQKKKIMLTFTGMAIASIATILLSKNVDIKKYGELAKELLEKSKTVLNDSVDIKEHSKILFDEATGVVKTVLNKLKSVTDANSLPQEVIDKNIFSFVDDSLGMLSAKLKKVDGEYKIQYILQKTDDKTQRLISCDGNGIVSNVLNGIKIGNKKTVTFSDAYIYEKGKIHIMAEDLILHIGDRIKGFSEKFYYFNGELSEFVDDVYFDTTTKKPSYLHHLKFKNNQLVEGRLGKLLIDETNENTEQILYFKNGKLSSFNFTNNEIPYWSNELIDDMILFWND